MASKRGTSNFMRWLFVGTDGSGGTYMVEEGDDERIGVMRWSSSSILRVKDCMDSPRDI